MKTTDFINESFVEDAAAAHQDHEVQMARGDCYNAAKYAIELHKLLKNISEQQGLDGWVSEKITLANDYLRTVTEYLRYEQQSGSSSDMPDFDVRSATQTLDAALSEDQATPGTWYLKKDGELITPYTSTKPYTFKSKEEAIAWAKEKFKVSYAQGKIYPEANPGLNLSPTVGPIDSYVGVKEEDEEPQQKRNPVVIKTNKPVGSRVADIGPGGKEYNVKTDKAWDDQHKEVKEGFSSGIDPQLVTILQQRGFKGPYQVGKLKKWYAALKEIGADPADEIMITGNDVDYDHWVIEAGSGHYAFGAEIGYTTGNAQKVIKGTADIGLDEERTVTRDETGKIIAWRDESDWRRVDKDKDGRGKVANLSDKARRETEKLQKDQGVDEGKADPTGSWVVYDGGKVKRFKTRDGAKAYAEKNGGKVASSEFYADNIQKQSVAEGERTMSRAAKGHEKYGKAGMQALAKAGREGASEKELDTIRDKHDKYENVSETTSSGSVATSMGGGNGFVNGGPGTIARPKMKKKQ